MSVWANAGGKPQLTYAERLRRATQGSAGSTTSGGQPTSTAPGSSSSSSTSRAHTSAPGTNRPKLVSDSNLSGSARHGASGSSAPQRQTLVTSSLTPSSSSTGALQRRGGAPLAPTSSPALHTSSRSGPTTRHSESSSASDPPASASSFASPTLHAPHLPQSVTLSASNVTASSAGASVNGDDAASATHSVHTTDSSAQSAVTAPSTSSTNPTSVATNNTTLSASRSGLLGLSSSSSLAISSNATSSQKVDITPPVNVWEARKKAMVEKQKVVSGESSRRAATAAGQQQAAQQATMKPKPAPSIPSSSSTVDAKKSSSSDQVQQQKSKAEGGSARKSQGSASQTTSTNASRGGERKTGAAVHVQQPSTGNATSSKGAGKQARVPNGQQGNPSQSANSGATAAAQGALASGDPAFTPETRRKGRTASHSGSVNDSGSTAGAKEFISTEADKEREGESSQPEGHKKNDGVGSSGQQVRGADSSTRDEDIKNANVVTSETAKGVTDEQMDVELRVSHANKDHSGSERLGASKTQSSSLDAANSSDPPTISSKDAFSSALNGAAAPFFSPMMGPHQGSQYPHGSAPYGTTGHSHHRYHAQHYSRDAEHHRSPRHQPESHHDREGYGLVEDGSVPLAPLPPPLRPDTEKTVDHPTHHRVDNASVDAVSSASVSTSLLRSPPLPAAPEYDNAWLERIHMLNGGQNMPVYGPLTLASTRKSAEDQEQKKQDAERAKSDDDQKDAKTSTLASSEKIGNVEASERKEQSRVGNGAQTVSIPSEDLASLPVEIETAAKELAESQDRDAQATTTALQSGSPQHPSADNHSRSSTSPQQQHHHQLYPDSRSRARRRSSTGHKGRKAGALAALASGPGAGPGSRKGSASGPGGAEGSNEDVAGRNGAVDPPPLNDAQSWPSPLDAKSAREHDRAVQARERATSAAATQAVAMAAAVSSASATGSHKASGTALALPNGKNVNAFSNASTAGPGTVTGTKAGAKPAAGAKKAKSVTGQNATDPPPANVSASVSSNTPGEESKQSASSTTPANAISNAGSTPIAADDSTPSGATASAAKKSGVPTKPLDTQVTRALAQEGAPPGSSLSPRPAHLPATPPPSLAMPPLTPALGGINGSLRGGAIGGGGQGRGGLSRTANGASSAGSATSQHGYGSYDYPNGPAIGSMVYPYQVGPMAASPMWNGTPSSPHPYHRPHRINKDGSFSPTRAVDYAGPGGAAFYGDSSMTSGYGGGRGGIGGGKRGRGRGGWRGGSSGSSSSRHREYSSPAQYHGSGMGSDIAPMQHAANFDPRYGQMSQAPQVYYVPYPVPVPYVASAPRTESSEASYTAAEGTSSAATNSEQASEAGAAPSSAAPTETGTPSLVPATATGYIHWQPGMTLTYPYFGMQLTAPASGMMPTDPVRAQALSQLDFYFSPRNLEGDFFLRQRMDSYGWVPIPVVAAFKKVRQITMDVNVIRDAMMYSENLEVDTDNWRVRKRYGWEEYVLPADQQVAIPPTSTPGPSSSKRAAASEGKSAPALPTEQAPALA